MAGTDDGADQGADQLDDGPDTDAGTDTGGDSGQRDDGEPGRRGIDDAAAAKIRRSASGQARRKLLEEAGVETVDELRELVGEAKQRRDQDLTEVEREKQALEAERAAAAAERRTLREQRIGFTLSEALREGSDGRPPIRRDRVSDVVAFKLDDLLSDDGDEDEAIAAAVADAFERWPEWFEDDGDDDQGSGTPSTPRRRGGERRRKDPPVGPRERAAKGYEALVSKRPQVGA